MRFRVALTIIELATCTTYRAYWFVFLESLRFSFACLRARLQGWRHNLAFLAHFLRYKVHSEGKKTDEHEHKWCGDDSHILFSCCSSRSSIFSRRASRMDFFLGLDINHWFFVLEFFSPLYHENSHVIIRREAKSSLHFKRRLRN